MNFTHGGDVDQAAREFGLRPDEILDFSSSINPLGLPPRAVKRLARDARDRVLLSRYPDPEAFELRWAIASHLSIPLETIVVSNGAAALIGAGFEAIAPRRCLIPAPGFAGYFRAAELNGCSVDRYDAFALNVDQLCQTLLAAQHDLIILNNPHNPSGALTVADDVRRVLRAACETGTAVIVDEAFIDYAPHAAITTEAAHHPRTIAIRSLTKFYGCPALRIGYAVAAPHLAAQLAMRGGAWPVTTLAQNALAEAIRCERHAADSLCENQRQRSKLASALTDLGFRVFPSAANFLLLELPESFLCSGLLRERLLQHHRILIRNCDSFDPLPKGRYVRVAVRLAPENQKLIAALKECI